MLRFCNNFSTAKELLTMCKYAFVDLHYCYGMDFQKPFSIYKCEGKFTRKSIEKMCGNGENFSESTAVLIMRGRERWSSNYKYGVLITDDGFEQEKNGSFPYHGNFEMRLSHFYSKKDFETSRKSYSGAYYIVIQRNKYINMENYKKEKRIDYSERVKILPENKMYFNGGKISQNGIKQHYSEVSYYKPERFDKSGYFNIGSEKRYSTKLRNLKAERARAAVNYAVISAHLMENCKVLNALRDALGLAILSRKILYIPHQYQWLDSRVWEMREAVEKRRIPSMERANGNFDYIEELGRKCLEWCKENGIEVNIQ